MTLASQFNWSSDFLPDSTLPSFDDTSCFLIRETDDDQTIAEGGLQRDTVASLNNLISASLTPGSIESELIASELSAELQKLPLEKDIAMALDEIPSTGFSERPSKRSRVALEFMMDDGAEGAASRFFPLVEHFGPEIAKIFQLVENVLAQTFKGELCETGDDVEDEVRFRIRDALQRLDVALQLRTIARQVMKILLTHRLSGDLEGQTEEQPPPYQPLYQPFYQPVQLSSSPPLDKPPPPISPPPPLECFPCSPPTLALPPPMAAAQEYSFSDCRTPDDIFDFDFGVCDFERQLSITGLERSGSFPFPPLETDGGVSSQLHSALSSSPPVPSYSSNALPSPKFFSDFPPEFSYPSCPDYGQSLLPSFVPSSFPSDQSFAVVPSPSMKSHSVPVLPSQPMSPEEATTFFNCLDPAMQAMILSKIESFQPKPDMRIDKPALTFRPQECPPYPVATPTTSMHDVMNKSLVIPKFVVPLWTPMQSGPHQYHEVRVCVQFEAGVETNLYNSIDLCVGAGLTAKQARVNLTKWRKKHPELAGVRGKMDGGVTHQSPYCVPIKAVQSIFTEFKHPGLLVYFLDDRGRERLNAESSICRWPTPFWADQMAQKRNASDLSRSKRKAASTNIKHFSDDEG